MESLFEYLLSQRSDEPLDPQSHGLDALLATDLIERKSPLVLAAGVRGTGKTSALLNLAKRLDGAIASPKNVLYLRMSDARISCTGHASLIDAVDAYLWRFPDVRKSKLYLVVDDLEYDERWLESFTSLQAVYDIALAGAAAAQSWVDKQRNGIFPPGTIVHELFPQSACALGLGEKPLHPDEERTSTQRFGEYFKKGGLIDLDTPMAAFEIQGQALVADALLLDVMPRDTRFTYQVVFPFMADVLSSTGRSFSIASAAERLKSRGARTTRATLTALLDTAEEARLMRRIGEFHHARNSNSRMAKMVYASDHGIAQCFCSPSEIDDECIARTMVFNELMRRNSGSGIETFFYRTEGNSHVDFALADASSTITLLASVCFAAPGSRESRNAYAALCEAALETGVPNAVFLTRDSFDSPSQFAATPSVMPVHRWLVQ
ncbi:MAG: ATP-binding protein [Eggerthellaceae bacterium]|nr:ATP-binding protein [Eggerthellaceae bacterium]